MTWLVDMNLSAEWVAVLEGAGYEARHWSQVGEANAPDDELFAHAREHGFTLLTQDLDFSRILFETMAGAPSVVLLRLGDDLGDAARRRVLEVIAGCKDDLRAGALLVIDPRKARLRRLPVRGG